MLRYLTDGLYQTETARFVSASGRPKYYYATDNIHSGQYRGLLPHDLIDICVMDDLYFHSSLERRRLPPARCSF